MTRLPLMLALASAVAWSAEPVDPEFKQKCLDGDALVCLDIAKRLESQPSVFGNNFFEAQPYYALACLHGAVQVCMDAASGRSKASLPLYEKGCEGGVAAACREAGHIHSTAPEGVPVDKVKAAELYGKACTLGYGPGCRGLGFLHQKGQGVPADPLKAAELYARGCQQGDPKSCTNHGVLLMDGTGVDQDTKGAADFFEKGCKGADGRGCSNLASLVEKGHHVSPQGNGTELREKACRAGWADDCRVAGARYRNGTDGTIQNVGKARELWTIGCLDDHARSCALLATVEGNPYEAEALLRQACELGDESACAR